MPFQCDTCKWKYSKCWPEQPTATKCADYKYSYYSDTDNLGEYKVEETAKNEET